MRIVHLGKYYPPSPGGIESHTRTLAQAQAALGADVRVIVVNHATADGRDATFDGLAITPTVEEWDGPVRVIRVGRWGNLAKLDVVPELPAIFRRLLRDPPDVWHLHAPNVTMMLALSLHSRVQPLVITHHSDIVRQRLSRRLIRPFERTLYRRTSRILSDSPGYVEGSSLLKQYLNKVDVLPLGIELNAIHNPSSRALEYRNHLRSRFGSTLWLCVGRLIYYKGFHVALDALCDVPGTLLVIGTGPLETGLKARAAALGLSDRIVWHGHASTDELIGAYHAATALWFPSVARSEGFGLVQVEAMAAGCPVVNTAVPGSGVSWVSRHEREGLTVPVNDSATFALAAKRLLAEPGLRDRLAAGSRRRAAEEFDHLVMGQRSLEVYRSVTKGGSECAFSI